MGTAEYERVIEAIQEQITSGQLQPGDRLPSIAKLAEQYETSRTTVKDALRILHRERWTRGQQGKATFVVGVPESRQRGE
jgi:DNA-binding FadR family transcriptional regulator